MSPISYHPGPDEPTPEQRLLLMDDEKWEAFIEQCARQLKVEGVYTQVVRIGGAGDKGRDVCGYSESQPTKGTWDLYQAKYYSVTLSPTHFAPELAKFLACVFLSEYTRPRNYYICALKIGPKLFDYISHPEQLKSWIITEWHAKNGNFGSFKLVLSQELESFIEAFPFEIIKVITPADLLEIHSRSDKHWEMFGVLASRQANPPVPEVPETDEQHYVKALLDVYQEAAQLKISEVEHIPPKFGKHFKSQRMLFYSAEGLNRFSRDKLPGAFEDLIDQVEVGIGGDLNFPHKDGLTRLTEVLKSANGLQVTSNPLHARLQAGDLAGTCHHLANQNRANWVDEDE